MTAASTDRSEAPICAVRLTEEPVIRAGNRPGIDDNVNGPSVIHAPPWAPGRLGRYYLYFSHHRGKAIRLAHADELGGPWRLHPSPVLRLEESLFPVAMPDTVRSRPDADQYYPHIASPDVHLVAKRRQVRMYFHGMDAAGEQHTRLAVSADGLSFTVLPDILAPAYLRAFRHRGRWYGLVMPGTLLRSPDGLRFEAGTELLPSSTRHCAVLRVGDRLDVVWSEVGDAPERLYRASVRLCGDWTSWTLAGVTELMRPQLGWEGAELPAEASRYGASDRLANELRDPCLFRTASATALFYVGGGERGIGVALLHTDSLER